MSTTSFVIVCLGTGVAKRYHYKAEGTLISTRDLFGMYYARLRTLGYKRDQLISQSAEHLFAMYERHKEWIRKGIMSPQLMLAIKEQLPFD